MPLSSSVACKITAPAPSPNKTQVFLSVQSTILEIVSAPITRAVFTCPVLIKLLAIFKA